MADSNSLLSLSGGTALHAAKASGHHRRCLLCCLPAVWGCVQAVGDAPVVQALSRASRADSAASSTSDLMKELLERFGSLTGAKGGRGGAEALFVLQVSFGFVLVGVRVAAYQGLSYSVRELCACLPV